MRAIFIFAGAALLQQFHWLIYVFGAVLIATAVKLLVMSEHGVEPEKNAVYRLFRRLVPCTNEYEGSRFFTIENGRRLATPLLLVLVLVEFTDLIFAVDSIPAIFAVTSDPFLVFTSNIFAVLGLRSLYFLLANVVYKFHFLKYGLSVILTFVGAKMLLESFFKLPILLSLAVIVGVLAVSIVLSLVFPQSAAYVAPGAREGKTQSLFGRLPSSHDAGKGDDA
jgi:tellurite resistance protein TerC